jgi:hypothetical protein
MAKKKSASEFNMSEAIREILTEDSKLSISETLEALKTKHPSAKINEKSYSVAFYTARNKLGIASRRRKKRSGTKSVTKRSTAPQVNLSALHSAKKFLSDVGSADTALAALKQVQDLQVK